MDGINRHSTTTIPQPRLNLVPTTTQRHKMDISAVDGKCAAIVHIRREIVYNTGP